MVKDLEDEQDIREKDKDDQIDEKNKSFIDKLILREDNNFLYAW
jgi:hypothetical protein